MWKFEICGVMLQQYSYRPYTFGGLVSSTDGSGIGAGHPCAAFCMLGGLQPGHEVYAETAPETQSIFEGPPYGHQMNIKLDLRQP